MGWGTWKGIGEHRDRIEMGRKKREVKGRNCGESWGSQGSGEGGTGPTHPWLDPKRWVGNMEGDWGA